MEFTENKKIYFTTVYIILVVYIVLAFIIPFNKGGSFWTGFGFSMIAILLAAGVGHYAFNNEKLISKYYRAPLILVVWRYLVIQLIVSLAEMVLYFIPFQYGLALNTALLGACLIGLIAIDVSVDEIERIDEKINEKVFYIKSMQADVEGLISKASDEAAKKELKALAETIRYSDPMSSPQLASIENKIEAKAAALTEAIEATDADSLKTLCNELQQLFAERNRKCKLLK